MSFDVLAMVLAGGMGERLLPLTGVRSKPAVPFGGSYRIIDFTLSNCINSGLRHIYVLTQYKSHSLSNHLRAGWDFLPRRLDQFIDEIPAQMQLGDRWYRGTADAIRQNWSLVEQSPASRVLILSGDHIYKMDYRRMQDFHDEREAALTVSAIRVPRTEAHQFGVLQVDEQNRIVGFQEKPSDPTPIPGTEECLASMGIYVFARDKLRLYLCEAHDDFGRHVLPAMVAAGEKVVAFDFTTQNQISENEWFQEGGGRFKRVVERAADSTYWRDVGTLEAYWAANLDLVSAAPSINLYGELWPIYNCPQHFPPAKFVHEAHNRTGMAINSIVADGVIVSGAKARRSILGPGTHLHSYAYVENSVLMGGEMSAGTLLETSIGRGCLVRNAIIDRNVRLSPGTYIGLDRDADEARGLKTCPIQGSGEHLVVVPKGMLL
ncbi:MAG: glucose-1-phosphate adenylyltransferase [Myxococcales bacterium]|jgi:glucose-1-phosphate adenylyltransferase|nr:glucose-1-phosphate adenylyltransferase [Myxococcales bacterium]